MYAFKFTAARRGARRAAPAEHLTVSLCTRITSHRPFLCRLPGFIVARFLSFVRDLRRCGPQKPITPPPASMAPQSLCSGLCTLEPQCPPISPALPVLCRRGEQKARLSFAWLLDHAKENREPETRQRRVVASEVDGALRPLEIRTQSGTLELRWPESVEQHGASRISQFSVAELLGAAHGEPAEDSRVAWDAGLFIQARHPSVSAAELRGDMGLRAALLLLREYGVLRLRDMPSSATETRELVEVCRPSTPAEPLRIQSLPSACPTRDGRRCIDSGSVTCCRPSTERSGRRAPQQARLMACVTRLTAARPSGRTPTARTSATRPDCRSDVHAGVRSCLHLISPSRPT